MILRSVLPRLLLATTLAGAVTAASCVREKPTPPVTPPAKADRDISGQQRERRPSMGALEADGSVIDSPRPRPTPRVKAR